MNHFYPWVWVAFIAWFFIWEFLALGSGHPEWSLSDYVWKLEDHSHSFSFMRYLVGVLSFWLFLHLTFGVLR